MNISSGESILMMVAIVSILVLVLGIVIALVTSQKISTPIRSVMNRMKVHHKWRFNPGTVKNKFT